MVICTKNDADKIFSMLADCSVGIDGQIVSDTLEMNRKFQDFNAWIIRRKDGSHVSKKGIKREIENIKIRDIESNWSNKYENRWNEIVSELESIILISTLGSMTAIHKDYLMRFFVR